MLRLTTHHGVSSLCRWLVCFFCNIPSVCNQLSHRGKAPSLIPCWRDVFRTDISHFQGLCVYWHEGKYSASEVKRRRHKRGKGIIPPKPAAITVASGICLMQVIVSSCVTLLSLHCTCMCECLCVIWGAAWQRSFILFLLFFFPAKDFEGRKKIVKKEKTCRNPFLWPHLPWKFLWPFQLVSLLTQEGSCSALPWGHSTLQH